MAETERPWLPPSWNAERRPAPRQYPLRVVRAGVAYHGHWCIEDDGRLCVASAYDGRTIDLRRRRREPAVLALEVFTEIVEAWIRDRRRSH